MHKCALSLHKARTHTICLRSPRQQQVGLFTFMGSSNLWQTLVTDRKCGPSGNEYIFYIRFNELPQPDLTVPEAQAIAAKVALKLIQPDRKQFKDWFYNLQVLAEPIDDTTVIKKLSHHDLGAAIKIWVAVLPMGSRLYDSKIIGKQLTQLTNESLGRTPARS